MLRRLLTAGGEKVSAWKAWRPMFPCFLLASSFVSPAPPAPSKHDITAAVITTACQIGTLIRAGVEVGYPFRLPSRGTHVGLPADIIATRYLPWLSGNLVLCLLVALGLLLTGAAAWGAVMRQRVREQTATVREWARREASLKAQYQELFENANDVVYTLDLTGKFTSLNRTGERVTGFSRDEVMGKSFMKAPPKEFQEHALRMFESKLQGSGPTTFELEILAKDGRRVPLEVSSRVVYQQDGKPAGIQGIARDVTERKRAEEERRKAAEAAEAANRAKSEFLANMSHEIRTPLNGIIGLTDLALETKLTTEQREYLAMVKSSADALLAIINDILDFSKIEAGRMDFDPIEFHLRDSLGDTLQTLAVRAHQKGLELALRASPEVPERVVADPGRLRQIVINLLSNAIKFTEEGEILLEVQREPASAGEQEDPRSVALRFTVSDTGVGIPEDKQRLIFEPFTQVDSSATRRHGGTGLGLAISTQLIERMGGRIWLESKAGKGTEFHFAVRFGVPEHAAENGAARAFAHLEGLSALIVDDNATHRRILEEILTQWKMQPVTASSGEVALDLLENASRALKPIRVVLVDALMPDMDGFELVEKIKQSPGLAKTTIVLLTPAGRRGDGARCRELGISAYLPKPVKDSDLLRAILLALGKEPADSRRVYLITQHYLREGRRGLRILVAEDNLVNQTLIVRLLEKRGHAATVAANGREVLEKLEAAGWGAFDAVLMDVQMPEMDGVETTLAIRKKEQSTEAHLPIIALTAHVLKGDEKRFLGAGMDAYVSKPIDPEKLVRAIERLAPAGDGDPRNHVAGKRAAGWFDEAAMLANVGGDLELLAELAGLFLQDCPALFAAVERSARERDGPALEKAAHKLKGTVSHFSAQGAYEAAVRLEVMGRSGDLVETSQAVAALEEELERLKEGLAAFNRKPAP